MRKLKKRFVIMIATLMYAILEISAVYVYAEERQESDIKRKKLLVAIDNSGSVDMLGDVIEEVLQVVSAFEKLEPEKLSVEYLQFNADGAERKVFCNKSTLPMEEQIVSGENAIEYRGETSVYKGVEEIGRWIDENKEEGEIGLLALSDFFSSRDQYGGRFSQKTAEREQRSINRWMAEWKKLIRNNCLNVLFIYWDSMTPGEDVNKTLDFWGASGNFNGGYQTELKGMAKNTHFVDEIHTGADINLEAEREIVEVSMCHIIKLITEERNIKWHSAGIIQQPDMYVTIKVPKNKRILIRIDKEGSKTGAKLLNSKNKNGDLMETILEGRAIELYYIKSPENRVIKLQAEQEGGAVYYLMFP